MVSEVYTNIRRYIGGGLVVVSLLLLSLLLCKWGLVGFGRALSMNRIIIIGSFWGDLV